ncbi:hypothetical protein DSO57_1002049 [Entomophthora muscae]|uniref:Uncharacterized protein n=1 Tax=Entomophthora muscae TaxID=34485 RepID=A0ACC2SB21_9FUNG|nr:hypothetical protein DSO57_1002049 [Entomophthora muscae]
MNSSIYKYYPTVGDKIQCMVCQYSYRKDAPLSTLQKHLRVKHQFSIRCPLQPEEMEKAIEESKLPVFRYLGPKPSKPKPAPIEQPKKHAIKRMAIEELINPNETGYVNHRIHAENAIAEWIQGENIPFSIATANSFYSMLRQINPDAILPSPQRLHQLITRGPKLNNNPGMEYPSSSTQLSYESSL